MTGKYKAYPEYKDSGVEWIGKIPLDWDMWKLTHACPYIASGTTPKSDGDNYYNGENLWVTTGELREEIIFDTQKKVTNKALIDMPTLRLHPEGSVAIAMYGATIGRLGIFGKEATTNQACCVMPPSTIIHNKFLFYWLYATRQEIINLSSGGGQPNVNQEKIASLKVSAPNYKLQAKIANFLDYETTKIDTLIKKQQQLIRLLKEKRQAVISHAVTKGFNSKAKMRESGIDWLGKIPDHWVSCPLKHYARIIDCKHITAEFFDDGIPLASIGEVKEWHVNLQSAKLTSEKYYLDLIEGGRKPQPGDIIYSRNATVGEAALVADGMPNFAMGQDVCLIRPDANLLPEFILHVLKSSVVLQQLDLAMVGSTFKRINVDDIRNFSLALPSVTEQAEIAEKINRALRKYDVLGSKAQAAIELMQDRRTALISTAVTGKIDLRNWVASKESQTNREVAA
ncbi:restriction endonuclease subunit S [Pseudomonas sp. JL3]|uniref:restriction endonuclease subunit S n=1 Tax=Pseudomonas sp. JL3 TaxID=2919943 RepID=UPI00285F5096|nr:restriction endonuclease subunit S [Pseudomonas sp. JL3]MDR8365035.1 restriction endonuclease subunit S [Pseudomonas sp. JL3]